MRIQLGAFCPHIDDDRYLFSSQNDRNRYLVQLLMGFLEALEGKNFPERPLGARLTDVHRTLLNWLSMLSGDPLCRTKTQLRRAYIRGKPAADWEYDRVVAIANIIRSILNALSYSHTRLRTPIWRWQSVNNLRYVAARQALRKSISTVQTWRDTG
jgi:hypothetical protein